MKRILYLYCLCFSCLLLRCTPPLDRMPLFDTMAPASCLTLMQDTTVVLIRDYFPGLEQVDNVTSSGLTVLPCSDWDTVKVVVTDKTPFITSLDIVSVEQKASLPVRIGNKPLTTQYIGGSGAPVLAVFDAPVSSDALCVIKVKYAPAHLLVYWQNSLVEEVDVTDQYNLLLPGRTALLERTYVRVYAYNAYGMSNDLLIPLEKGRVVEDPALLNRSDKHSQIMYQVFIDRFHNGDLSNDQPLNLPDVLPRVDYMGGDLAGVTQKIQAGYFEDLGVNTIWLTPISQNTKEAWGKYPDPPTRFSAYHGYWPIYLTRLDDHFGTESQLNTLITAAHALDENVLLDFEANHMNRNSPTVKAHPDWITPNVTPDGRPNLELWEEYRLSTWVDSHIPKFDFSQPVVCEALSDSALFWLENFEFDGFRHDATKHIDEQYWRMLTEKIITRFPSRNIYQIGETYGDPFLIGSYVKSGLLDGQFDFNVYDAFINATVRKGGSFMTLWNVLQQSLTIYGYHNLMAYITGNQDRPRYISLAGGQVDPDEDTKLAGWKRQIGVGNEVAYTYMAMLHAMNMTLPGIPCIYYGDEIGLPGANDPDNRRMMVFDGYDSHQEALKEKVKKLTYLRHHSMALLYGDVFPLYTSDDVLAYVRLYMGQAVVVCMNKGTEPFEITDITLPFDLSWDAFTPYMGSSLVEGPGFAVLTNK